MAIEYNMWLSIIKLINDTVKSSSATYGIGNIDIPVLPAYPRNLSKFTKPSIIVQKVGTDNTPVCFGNFVGQYHNDIDNSDTDIFGINCESTYQIDVCGDNNTQCSLITSLILDEIFSHTRIENNGQIMVYNFASSLNDPQFIGYAKLDPIIDVENLDRTRLGNEYKVYNYDYVNAIRFDASIIQISVPKQDLIDLTKPIKITQRVKL